MSHKPIHIIGLTGPAGCGKDTVAAYLRDHARYSVRAFADALRAEVCEAFFLPIEALTDRASKETPTELLSLRYCKDTEFCNVMALLGNDNEFWTKARSPRAIMQAWGTDYRRKRSRDDYWLDQWIETHGPGPRYVIPDVRFANEAEFVREQGGQVWKVTRPGTGLINSHASETTGDTFNPERTIFNDRGLPELRTETLRNLWEATSGLQITILGNLTGGDA
jgi:hypothetical protein